MNVNLLGSESGPGDKDELLEQELLKAAAACEFALLGKFDEEQLIGILSRLSLFLPTSEPLAEGANWKPLHVQRGGVMWVMVFTNREVAGEFAQMNTSIQFGRVVKTKWILEHVPENFGVAICHKPDRVVQMSPNAVKVCRDYLRSRDVS